MRCLADVQDLVSLLRSASLAVVPHDARRCERADRDKPAPTRFHPSYQPSERASVHSEREAQTKVEEEAVQSVDIDKLNGAVERLT